MSAFEKYVRNIKDIRAKTVFPGVEERVLISPETVGSKFAILKHYVAERGAKFEFQYPTEVVFYFMAGEGIATVQLYQPYASDILLETYVAFWVPPERRGIILNTGEGPLRFLMTSTTEKQEKVNTGPDRRNPTVTRRSQAPLLALLKSFGLEHRMLFRETPFKYLGRIYATEFQRFPSGSKQLLHKHNDAEQTVYVTRGHGQMQIGKEKASIGPGTAMCIPKPLEHSVENTSSDFLDIFVMMNNIEP